MGNIINFKFPHQTLDGLSNVQANSKVMKYLRLGLIITGLEVYLPNYKENIRTFMLFAVLHPVIISFGVLMFSNEPISVKLEAVCAFVILCNGIQKFWNALLNDKYFFKTLNQLRDLHEQYKNDKALAAKLTKISFYWFVITEFLVVCYVSVAIAYYLLPLFMWHVYHEKVTIVPIPFPLIDWRQPIGYTINMIHQFFLITYGVIGIITADTMFLYQILHTIAYRQILEHRVMKLNKLIEIVPQNLQKIEEQLAECIRGHLDFISYIEMLDKNYFILCFGQLVVSTSLLTMSLFMTLWIQWIVGPFISLAGVFQLLEHCTLGTVVTVQNDEVSTIIYGMSWYMLPVRLQRHVILMIARAQKPTELNVGGFCKLNVATALQILKTVYSYLMMMLRFLG